MVPECLPSWLLETADQYPYFHYQYPYSIITTCISCGCRDPAPLGQYGGGFTLRLESPNMKVKPSVRPVSSLGCAFVIMLSPAFGLRRETALPAGEGRCLRAFHADRHIAGLGRHR
jgi:hypothetical protein